jgi:hypothetical protein
MEAFLVIPFLILVAGCENYLKEFRVPDNFSDNGQAPIKPEVRFPKTGLKHKPAA